MPDEDKNFGGLLVLDFRKRWRHVKTIYRGRRSAGCHHPPPPLPFNPYSHPTKKFSSIWKENLLCDDETSSACSGNHSKKLLYRSILKPGRKWVDNMHHHRAPRYEYNTNRNCWAQFCFITHIVMPGRYAHWTEHMVHVSHNI